MSGQAALLLGILVFGTTAGVRAQSKSDSSRRAAVDRFNGKVVALSQSTDLSVETVRKALGVRLGPVKHETPYRRSWPILPNPLIAGGHILQMGKHTNVEIRPRPGLKITFEDVAAPFLDEPYAMTEHRAHVGDPDSMATRIIEITHEFRVLAGVVRVGFELPARDNDPEHNVRAMREGSETADGKRNLPVESLTVSDNLYKGWTTTLSLRSRRSIRGVSTGR